MAPLSQDEKANLQFYVGLLRETFKDLEIHLRRFDDLAEDDRTEREHVGEAARNLLAEAETLKLDAKEVLDFAREKSNG